MRENEEEVIEEAKSWGKGVLVLVRNGREGLKVIEI
jgi:hypothetical protein